MTRAEHLQWCKDRAMAYFNEGNLVEAMTSMLSDMRKHPETELKSTEGTLMMLASLYIRNHDRASMKRWIEGFN